MSDLDEYDTGVADDVVSVDSETPAAVVLPPPSPSKPVNRRKSSTPVRRKNIGSVYTKKMAIDALVPSEVTVKPPRRKYRHRSGVVALREIRKYQTTTGTLIDKAPFRRLLKDITNDLRPGIRWRKEAVLAIQESVESLLTELFSNSRLYTQAAGRETLMAQDLRLAFHNKFGDLPTMDFTKLLH